MNDTINYGSVYIAVILILIHTKAHTSPVTTILPSPFAAVLLFLRSSPLFLHVLRSMNGDFRIE
jgi:hypothetical protein